MHEALCRPSGTTLDIVHAEGGPPITQRTSGLSGGPEVAYTGAVPAPGTSQLDAYALAAPGFNGSNGQNVSPGFSLTGQGFAFPSGTPGIFPGRFSSHHRHRSDSIPMRGGGACGSRVYAARLAVTHETEPISQMAT